MIIRTDDPWGETCLMRIGAASLTHMLESNNSPRPMITRQFASSRLFHIDVFKRTLHIMTDRYERNEATQVLFYKGRRYHC